MLFVSIPREELVLKLPDPIDGLELRLDLFPKIDFSFLKNLIENSAYPIMFTLRKASQGGLFKASEKEREALIQKLLLLKPAFFDLEYDMTQSFLKKAVKEHPEIKFIISYHNFQNTPPDLEKIYGEMKKIPAFGYKIATYALSVNDALRLFLFAKKHLSLSAISMGEKAEFSRILGPICGNLINYASLNDQEKTALGQLSVQELQSIYNFAKLNAHTDLYGLIGDPITNSLGHLYHNSSFEKKKRNAVYVKMNVKVEELPTFFSLAKEMGFKGLSVTMPLKEKVLDFLDTLDSKTRQIQAVNTLLFKNGNVFGTNTDGLAALEVIEKNYSVEGKKIVILGAGGAARAIAFEALKRKATVLILNRSLERAIEVAKSLGCDADSLLNVPAHYDILINCTSHPMPIDPKKIRPSSVVMDVTYVPKETTFLMAAKDLGCPIIYGEEMFLNQAVAQQNLWTKDSTL